MPFDRWRRPEKIEQPSIADTYDENTLELARILDGRLQSALDRGEDPADSVEIAIREALIETLNDRPIEELLPALFKLFTPEELRNTILEGPLQAFAQEHETAQTARMLRLEAQRTYALDLRDVPTHACMRLYLHSPFDLQVAQNSTGAYTFQPEEWLRCVELEKVPPQEDNTLLWQVRQDTAKQDTQGKLEVESEFLPGYLFEISGDCYQDSRKPSKPTLYLGRPFAVRGEHSTTWQRFNGYNRGSQPTSANARTRLILGDVTIENISLFNNVQLGPKPRTIE